MALEALVAVFMAVLLSGIQGSTQRPRSRARFVDMKSLSAFFGAHLHGLTTHYLHLTLSLLILQLFPSSHWSDLRVGIVVVSDQRKSTPSSEGMKRSVLTSALLRHRADVVVPAQMDALRAAIAARDFPAFAEIAMKESNSLHKKGKESKREQMRAQESEREQNIAIACKR